MITMSGIMKGAFMSLFFFTTAIGNSLVFYIGLKNWKHTKNHMTHFLVFNLAIADLLVTILAIPFEVTEEFTDKWHFGNFLCKAVEYTQAVSLGASVFIVTFIAIDRNLCIVRPLSPVKIKPRHGKYIIALAWSFPLLISLPYLVVCGVQRKTFIGTNHTTLICETEGLPYPWMDKLYWTAEMYFTIILPLSVMVFCYSRLLKKVISLKRVGEPKQPSQQNESSSSDPIQHNLNRIKIKSVKLTVAFISTFIICWTPKFVLDCMRLALGTKIVHRRSTIYEISLFMSYVNETLNPVIYALFDPYFQRKVLRMLGKKDNLPGSTTDTSVQE